MEDNKLIQEQSRQAFERARKKAFLAQALATLRGKSNKLLAYDEVRAKLRLGGSVYRGIKSVAISQIVGSVGRYRDFDRAFLPTQTQTEHRWQSIGRAFYSSVNLPPVKLYQIGEIYFVVDGNHRVSVARELGQEFIDAEVQECKVKIPISADLRAEDLEIIGEKIDFYTRTGFDTSHPDSDFKMTIAGGYRILLEHIAVHRYLQSQEWKRDFEAEEAAQQWVVQVYLPFIEVIREADALKEFPGRTEADLYVWTIEHLHFLREQIGADVSIDDGLRSFAGSYAPGFLKRLWQGISGSTPK